MLALPPMGWSKKEVASNKIYSEEIHGDMRQLRAGGCQRFAFDLLAAICCSYHKLRFRFKLRAGGCLCFAPEELVFNPPNPPRGLIIVDVRRIEFQLRAGGYLKRRVV